MAGQTIKSSGFASLFSGVEYGEIEVPVTEHWFKAAVRRLFGMNPKTSRLKDCYPVQFRNFVPPEPQGECLFSEPMNPEKW